MNFFSQLNHSHLGSWITSLDINPTGETIATIYRDGTCLMSDLDANNRSFQLQLTEKSKLIWINRDFLSFVFKIECVYFSQHFFV